MIFEGITNPYFFSRTCPRIKKKRIAIILGSDLNSVEPDHITVIDLGPKKH